MEYYQDNGLVIVDLREPEKFESFHLDSAVSVPLEKLDYDNLKKYVQTETDKVLFICDDGSHSAKAALIAGKIFPHIRYFILENGLNGSDNFFDPLQLNIPIV
jgi:rhodanese-related sulfurtransferase